ncbi:Pycsar system effector family protein [Pareuzebyella sediminis]|uniref:Pycsar system effector family protein n=1 Tax=Pareuzebyella sediminis TaxID=2607998 RepID=UPI0011F00B4A|nr:Pycsar system effector family protein [Pareuzebyella sediminis]
MNIKNIQLFVNEELTKNLGDEYLFHNLQRAKGIVEKASLILDEKDDFANKNIILAAAWFLYVGFSKDYTKHVQYSRDMAASFLKKEGWNDNDIITVQNLIESAWDYNQPLSLEAELLKDVRTAFYGSEDFIELLELQRLEMKNVGGQELSPSEIRTKYLNILNRKHQFYTDYAISNWQEQREANIINLVGKSLKAKKTEKKEKLKVKLKNNSPERATQSLYRTQLRNHLKLSDIADTKANILLSVNAIIISLLMANLIPKLDTPRNSYLIYPTVIFVVFSIASMIMSVLATRPKIENKDLIDKNMESDDTNFLFFGNFHTLALPDFKRKVKSIIASKESIYDSLTMDLYYLGLVLKKKYQLLRWTYTIFIVGIILSVIAFAVALKYYGMGEELIEAVSPGL